jgi:hypothetical protein
MEMVVSRARFDLVKETVSEALDRLVQLNWVEVVEIEATSANPMQVVENVPKSGESPDVPANFPAEQNRTEQNKYSCPTDVGQNGSNHTKRNSLRKATDPWTRDAEFIEFFDREFWPAWPRKQKKKAAITVLWKIRKEHGIEFLPETVLPAVKAQKQPGGRLNPESGTKYIPLLATWLNGEEWENQDAAQSPERETRLYA